MAMHKKKKQKTKVTPREIEALSVIGDNGIAPWALSKRIDPHGMRLVVLPGCHGRLLPEILDQDIEDGLKVRVHAFGMKKGLKYQAKKGNARIRLFGYKQKDDMARVSPGVARLLKSMLRKKLVFMRRRLDEDDGMYYYVVERSLQLPG